MKEIEFLTEKDLPYFRKKAEEGEVAILEIPPKQLLHMDLRELLQGRDAASEIDPTEVQKWISDNRSLLQEEYEKGVQEVATQAKSEVYFEGAALADRLAEIELTPEKRAVIERAINLNFSEPILLFLLSDYFIKDDVTAEEMQAMIRSIEWRF